jgi:hypothetical protein
MTRGDPRRAPRVASRTRPGSPRASRRRCAPP